MSDEQKDEGGMPANVDEAKGRAKSAAGEVTGDDEMKREGTVDKATGAVKDTVDSAADKAKDVVSSDEEEQQGS